MVRTAVGYDQDRSFMPIEISGDELNFQTISRTGKTVDSGVIKRAVNINGLVGDESYPFSGFGREPLARSAFAR
jgi:hypothetical protein